MTPLNPPQESVGCAPRRSSSSKVAEGSGTTGEVRSRFRCAKGTPVNGLVLLLMILAGCVGTESPKSPFVLSVVPTASSRTGGTISMALDRPWPFYVVLTNISNEPKAVWEDGNSWGYYAISFEVSTDDGHKVIISKQPQIFGKNTPVAFLVRPGEHKVYEIRLNEDWAAHGTLRKTNEMSITLKARYDVSPTPEGTERQVLTGHIESHDYELHLQRW
jgi:hypothetical protein